MMWGWFLQHLVHFTALYFYSYVSSKVLITIALLENFKNHLNSVLLRLFWLVRPLAIYMNSSDQFFVSKKEYWDFRSYIILICKLLGEDIIPLLLWKMI